MLNISFIPTHTHTHSICTHFRRTHVLSSLRNSRRIKRDCYSFTCRHHILVSSQNNFLSSLEERRCSIFIFLQSFFYGKRFLQCTHSEEQVSDIKKIFFLRDYCACYCLSIQPLAPQSHSRSRVILTNSTFLAGAWLFDTSFSTEKGAKRKCR